MGIGPLKVLLIEDNSLVALAIQDMLAKAENISFELECTNTLHEGLKYLAERDVDVVLLDLVLPDSEGYETFLKVRNQIPELPIVVFTGIDDEVLATRAVREGAQDYLIKGEVTTDLLVRTIRYAIERKQAEEALRKAYDGLEQRVRERTAELKIINEQLIKEIEERKRIEEELRKSKEYAELLYRLTPSAIFTVDTNRCIRSCNKRAEEITGYSSEEIIGKECAIFAEEPCKERCELYSEDVRKPIIAKECTIKRKDGQICIISKNLSLLKDEKGNIIGGVESFEDITERKRAEEELQGAYDQLRAAQSQLIQAAKMEVIGRLASGIIHEVKNPLAIILMGVGYLSGREEYTKNEEIRLALENMKEAAKRADYTIKGLLDFSRISQMEVAPYDLNSIVEKALGLVEYQIVKNHIEVTRDFGKNIPYVTMDKNKIEQAFVNILLNAIQAMPKGGKLTVRTYLKKLLEVGERVGRRKDDTFELGEEVAVVEVEDTGPGIPEEILDKIFDPFFTTKSSKGGTGLGLSIVKSIIDMHNGKIKIENKKEGQGAKATIILKI
jgi:PAS domain S-box-containing protein